TGTDFICSSSASPCCPLPSYSCNTTSRSPIDTLSLHDALPIFDGESASAAGAGERGEVDWMQLAAVFGIAQENHLLPFDLPQRVDRKSTRLNSSHLGISYAVFCLKKKTGRTGKSVRCR